MKTMTVIFDGTITVPMGYASSKDSKKDLEKKTSYQGLPVMDGKFILPGEQLAGALRRAGMDDILSAFPENPLLSILSYYQASVGGIAGFGHDYAVGEMSALRRVNPFLSLWGKSGLNGHIGLGHAIGPDTETVTVLQGKEGPYKRATRNACRVHGFRSDDLSRNPETVLPDEFWRQRAVLKIAGKSPETAKEVANFAEHHDFFGFPLPADVDSQAAEVASEEADAESTSGKLTNIQNGYGGFEYLPNGTRFSHRFSVTGTEAELLMLMASFHGFARKPRLGGHWRHNLGWVDLQYTVYLREEDLRLAPREIGTLSINSHLEDLTTSALETTGVVAQWMDDYLALRQQQFPGMDINAGTDAENEVIIANLAKIRKGAEKDASRKTARKGKDPKPSSDDQGVSHVA